jgi:DNA-directed RNA polymerase specialized sigma24 family protein
LLDWAQHLMEEACARHGVVPAPILRALQQQLMPQLLRKCRNHQEAEEQLQEILKIFIEKYRSGTIHGGLLQYARGISRYRNMQRHRKRQQQKEIHRALEARKRPHAPVMEQELDTRIALRQITDLVEKNPAWEALISICVGELTAADLEQETGILSGTLRSKVSRMRKTLRRELTSALGGLMTLWGLLHRRPAHAAGLFAAGAGALAVLIASSGGSAQAPPLQHRVLTAAASPDLFPATLTVPSISVSRPAPSARPVSVVAPVRQVAPDAQPAAPALVAITAEPEPTATSAGGDQLLDAIEAVQIARSHLSDAPEIALELVGPLLADGPEEVLDDAQLVAVYAAAALHDDDMVVALTEVLLTSEGLLPQTRRGLRAVYATALAGQKHCEQALAIAPSRDSRRQIRRSCRS